MLESDNAALVAELKKTAQLPSTRPIATSEPFIGPYVLNTWDGSYYVMIAVDGNFQIGTDCGGGYTVHWTNGSTVAACRKQI
jgi:hypothetical protein